MEDQCFQTGQSLADIQEWYFYVGLIFYLLYGLWMAKKKKSFKTLLPILIIPIGVFLFSLIFNQIYCPLKPGYIPSEPKAFLGTPGVFETFLFAGIFIISIVHTIIFAIANFIGKSFVFITKKK